MQNLLANKKLLIIIGGAVVVFILALVLLISFLFRSVGPVTITYWGLWEPESVYATVIADYKRTHPNVTIKYLKQSPQNYRDRLITALAKEDSPDIVRIHNTWMPMLKNSLVAAPSNIAPLATFKQTFYPVVSKDLTLSNQVMAVPLEIDTLAMYVNDDIFKAAGVSVPTVWDGNEGVLAVARKLTVRDNNNRIKTSGAALGTATNVDHWQDIVSAMLLQTGVDLSRNANASEAQQAMAFYTAFASTEKIWDETLDSSTLAFASGKVGMYFAPSWRWIDIKTINPNLNFRVVPLPQLTGGERVNFATYWAEAVSKKSKNSKAAWDFLNYLTSKDVLTKLYAAEAKIDPNRPFGEPYSRVDMAPLLASDVNLSTFLDQAQTAKSWYLAGYTRDGDTGINSRIGNYFEDAINSAARGGGMGSMDTVAKGIQQVLESYSTAK